MKKNQLILLCLCAFLAIGVFLPLVTAPIIGQMNYFKNGDGDGVWILLCAAVGAGLTFSKYPQMAFLPGLAAMVILMLFYMNYKEAFKEFEGIGGSNYGIFNAFAETLVNSVNLSYGFIVMAVSATGLTFLSPILADKVSE